MPFVDGVADDAATGVLAEMFAADRRSWGYLPNFASTFGLRPEVYQAWRQLIGAIQANMDPRRYELATVAAAVELRSSYCSLAHGRTLAKLTSRMRSFASSPTLTRPRSTPSIGP